MPQSIAASVPPADASSPTSNQPLRRDVRMLGFELGKTIQKRGKPGLFALVEEIRSLAKDRRAGSQQADMALRKRIAGLSEEDLGELIRALSCFFDLANLAEDRHRIRVLRQREMQLHPEPRPESLGAAIHRLHAAGHSAEQVRQALEKLEIELVLTAHPTEAKRRTVRNLLKRLRSDLIKLDREILHLTPRERERLLGRIQTDLDCLWETDSLRARRPTVLGEVSRSLFVYDTLWSVVPWLARQARRAFASLYPDQTLPDGSILRFGSWIGGDRDGNPFVTAEVTQATLQQLREEALQRHLDECRQMTMLLSISRRRHRISEALEQRIATYSRLFPTFARQLEESNADERYRLLLQLMYRRLELAREASLPDPAPAGAYTRPQELLNDLLLIRESLLAGHHDHLAGGELQEWIDRVRTFGFHLARLDIREDSAQLHLAIDQLANALDLLPKNAYAEMDDTARQAFLTAPIDPKRARSLSRHALPEAAREALDLFDLLETLATHHSSTSLGGLIISMTHSASDALSMPWLSRLAATRQPDNRAEPAAALPIIPLFETIDDLERAHGILAELMAQPTYARHVREQTGNRQICMIGYSDSAKDGGYLASTGRLYTAQQHLAALGKELGIDLVFFHGRGGALGRGGGPAARSVLSLPPESVQHRLRVTEQGEVLAERYDDPEIAYRHLEQVSWATLLVSELPSEPVEPACSQQLEIACQAAEKKYRALKDDPRFLAYFDQASPINTIENLPIGSRPSRRRSQARRLEHLRAIPYTFAWTQNRHLITAFFGMGTGLESAARSHPEGEEAGWDSLAGMYRSWAAFRATIDNAEVALAKADMPIAEAYAALVSRGEEEETGGPPLIQIIREEYDRSRQAVLRIKQHTELLEEIPWFQHAIRVRNPYIDPLNFIQIELLKRAASLPEEGDDARRELLTELLRLSVQGIAAGMRTTG